MGNLISAYLDRRDGQKSNQNASNSTAPVEVADPEVTAQKELARTEAAQANPPAALEGRKPLEVTDKVNHLVSIFKSMETETVSSPSDGHSSAVIITEIERILVSLYEGLASRTIELLQANALAASIRLPDDGSDKSAIDRLSEVISAYEEAVGTESLVEVLKGMEPQRATVEKRVSEEIEGLLSKMAVMYDRWKAIDITTTVERASTYQLKDFIETATAIQDELKAIISEGDDEMAAMKEAKDKPTIEMIVPAFTALHDLYDDDSRVTELQEAIGQLTDRMDAFDKELAEAAANRKANEDLLTELNNKQTTVNSEVQFIESNVKENVDRLAKVESIRMELNEVTALGELPEELSEKATKLNTLYDPLVEAFKKVNDEKDALAPKIEAYNVSLQSKMESVKKAAEEAIPAVPFDESLPSFDQFRSLDTSADAAYDEFMSLYSMMVNDLTELYKGIISKHQTTIADWESSLESKRKQLEETDVQPLPESTVTNQEIGLYESQFYNSKMAVDKAYSEVFNSNVSSSYISAFNKQKDVYLIVITAEPSPSSIQSEYSAFVNLEKTMNDVDAKVKETIALAATCNGLRSKVIEMRDAEEERRKRAELEAAFDQEWNTLSGQISEKVAIAKGALKTLQSIKDEMKSFEQNLTTLFGQSDALIELGSSDDVGGFGKKAADAALDAKKEKSTYDSKYSDLIALVELIEQNSQLVITEVEKLRVDAAIDDIYKRPSIDELKKRIETLHSDAISAKLSEAGKLKDELADMYIKLSASISIAYEYGSAIDDRFKSFSAQTIESYREVLKTFDEALTVYQERADRLEKQLEETATHMRTRYEQLMYVLHPDQRTVAVDADTERLAELYDVCEKEFSDIEAYIKQSDANDYNRVKAKLSTGEKDLLEVLQMTEGYLNEYQTKTKQTIDNLIAAFRAKMEALTNESSLSEAAIAKEEALAAYKGCNSMITTETEQSFETRRCAAEEQYRTGAGLIYNELTSVCIVLSQELSSRKRLIRKYGNAAALLAYIYGHYFVGRIKPSASHTIDNVPWKKWIHNEVVKRLQSEEPGEELDVFEAMCLYTPALPLLWPYGSTAIEVEMQSDKQITTEIANATIGSRFHEVNKDRLIRYVSNELVTYIENAIINTMRSGSDPMTPLEQYADFYRLRSLSESFREHFEPLTDNELKLLDDVIAKLTYAASSKGRAATTIQKNMSALSKLRSIYKSGTADYDAVSKAKTYVSRSNPASALKTITELKARREQESASEQSKPTPDVSTPVNNSTSTSSTNDKVADSSTTVPTEAPKAETSNNSTSTPAASSTAASTVNSATAPSDTAEAVTSNDNDAVNNETAPSELTKSAAELEAAFKATCDEYVQVAERMNELLSIMSENQAASTSSDPKLSSMKETYEKASKEYDELNSKREELVAKLARDREAMQNAYNASDAEESSETVAYWKRFIEAAMDCSKEEDHRLAFAKTCKQYLDASLFASVADQLHIAWKLVVYASGKRPAETVNYLPAAFPLLSHANEKREAAIMLLNRMFSFLGYPTAEYYKDNAAQRISYSKWINQGLTQADIVPGGMCIGYSDALSFKTMMGSELFMIENVVSSEYRISDLSDCVIGNFFECTDVTKEADQLNVWLKYANPTGIIDYVFRQAPVNQSSLDCISIDNFCKRNMSKDLSISMLIDALVADVDTLPWTYSVGYLSSMYAKVFDSVIGSALSWTYLFPILPNVVKEDGATSKTWYRMPKINAIVRQQTGSQGTAATFYSIFDPTLFK